MMDESAKNQTDCGCNNNSCCTPSKKSYWQKIALILIVAAAISIAVWKLYFCNNGCINNKPGCCPKDSTELVQKDTSMSCCSKKVRHSDCTHKTE